MKKKTLLFLGGALTSFVAERFIKTKTAREGAIKALSYAMITKDNAMAGYTNIKEEAADLAYEAKLRAKAEARQAYEAEEAKSSTTTEE